MPDIPKEYPTTPHLAFEFADEKTTLTFLQKCMDEYPSVRVTPADQCTIIVARDMITTLGDLLVAMPPEQVHPVYPMSGKTPEDAARIRGWSVGKNSLKSYDAMLVSLENLAEKKEPVQSNYRLPEQDDPNELCNRKERLKMIGEVLERWEPFPLNPDSEGAKRPEATVKKWREVREEVLEQERVQLAKHFGLTEKDLEYFADLDRRVREFEEAHIKEEIPPSGPTRLVPTDPP